VTAGAAVSRDSHEALSCECRDFPVAWPPSDSQARIGGDGGISSTPKQTEAAAINNNGQVTGFSQTSTDADHGFLWSNGKMTDLGLNFFPAAINDNGVIVGGDEIYSGGTLQNLNNLIPAGSPQISYAVAINDNGQIVATSGGQTLLLTPN
jgi:probable HAF family extracellular repeat protein